MLPSFSEKISEKSSVRAAQQDGVVGRTAEIDVLFRVELHLTHVSTLIVVATSGFVLHYQDFEVLVLGFQEVDELGDIHR